ncbi:hypothetical protein CYLTODRAFT_419163 [Cylindrobasidium torrendii FP15055 ss-10]|uniref:Uncharacterized protein n=1 Tax=Cylindrobasidium torrendii FP15055 ss-10 TaxID=1314674 RepID=A0A0D7BLX5_9AGAR|nr:hypothetical protein CYLTODRAFT_419163 [Cylindrobasidium torrendii FP15055 ss-10]
MASNNPGPSDLNRGRGRGRAKGRGRGRGKSQVEGPSPSTRETDEHVDSSASKASDAVSTYKTSHRQVTNGHKLPLETAPKVTQQPKAVQCPPPPPQPAPIHQTPTAALESESEGSRGRGRGRGGLGKHLRARGRGHRGGGRPAQFGERLVLEGERPIGEEEEEENQKKFRRRNLGTNTSRYEEGKEHEGENDDERLAREEQERLEAEEEAQMLAQFLDRQRLSAPVAPIENSDADDVDHTLAHISSKGFIEQKRVVEEIEWDEDIEQLQKDMNEADASRELTARFRAKSEKLKRRPLAPTKRDRKLEASYIEAPALPVDPASINEKRAMQDFLDDLIS